VLVRWYGISFPWFITDKNSYTLRQKILAKFTPKIKPITSGNKSDKNQSVLASIERIPSPIPAKFQKEVNQISKYFRNTKSFPINKPTYRSYSQASKLTSKTADIIKIKNTFSAINAKKINQIQNIIKGSSKPKLCIQMTMKGPSRKQVIILMNRDNTMNFIKESF